MRSISNLDDNLCKTLKTLLETESLQIKQLDKLFHLLEEMTEITDNFILWLMDYCDKHQIPFLECPQLKSYIRLSRRILKETKETMVDLKLTSTTEFATPKKNTDRRYRTPTGSAHIRIRLRALANRTHWFCFLSAVDNIY